MQTYRSNPGSSPGQAPTPPPRVPPLGLTMQEATAVRAIQRITQAKRGASPSYEELGKALRIASKSGVHRIVGQLERKGWVVRVPGAARSLRLLAQLSPDGRVEAIGVAESHLAWAHNEGQGLFRILDELGIAHADAIGGAEAAGLIAEYWLGVRALLQGREAGRG